jgi:two-component system, NtrC family, sensor kinase
MTEPVTLLFVDDEVNILRSVERMFLDENYRILTASSGPGALRILESGPPVHVVVSDYRMPGMNGVELLRTVHRRWPDTVRIVLSGYSDTAAVVSAINEGGIFKFIAKPWNGEDLKITMANAATLFFLQRRVSELVREVNGKNELIARLQEQLLATTAQQKGELP